MQRDRSLGNLDWRGCHSFTGITFDDLQGNAAKRDGALKMGGTYWYYYRLDDDSECHNPAEPFTSSCPLLPGQYVNVLEVPVQYVYPSSAANTYTSSFEERVFTLDPTDKFVSPQPPSPKKTKRLRLKTRDYRGTSEDDFKRSKFARLTSAAWTNLQFKPEPVTQKRPQPQRAKTSASAQSWPRKPEGDRNHRPCYSASAQVDAWFFGSQSTPSSIKKDESDDSMPCCGGAGSSNHGLPDQEHALLVSDVSNLDLDGVGDPAALDHAYSIHRTSFSEDQNISRGISPDPYVEEIYDFKPLSRGSSKPSSRPQPEMLAETSHEVGHPSAASSKRTSVFSLLESMTGLTNSPEHHHSQPITPSVSEFGELVLNAFEINDSPNEELYPVETIRQAVSFSGYSLPAAEYASTITLRAAPSPSRKRPGDPNVENAQRVEKWDDGSEQPQKSALQDLVDEMGYLSSLIG